MIHRFTRSIMSNQSAAKGLRLWACAGLAVLAFAFALYLLAPAAFSQAQFADPAFRTTWDRADGLVASGAVSRGWVWGAVPGKALQEAFSGLPGNTHSVQYFDKGRMEINDPNVKKDDPFYVTNGLLAVELISGQQQNGIAEYQYRGPAAIDLASDADDPSAPTYQSFNGVSNIPGAPNERHSQPSIGTTVRTAIDRQGITQPWPQDHPDYGVRIAYFEPATGHNIPDVFWDYLNKQAKIIQDGQPVIGPLFYPWFSITGYPISEPYWSYVKVEGAYTDVLIQAFERRVLTYVPHFDSDFKVQMGNIGQHYYDWRYLNAGGSGKPGPATPTAAALPPKANIVVLSINYRKSLIDFNGNFITIRNDSQTPVSFNGWWLDSPKWDHVDRYYFPNGVTLASGGILNIHSGPGRSTATDLYMGRTTVMWDNMPYDLAILYDNFGREIVNYFPASDTGPPPTPVPATATPGGPTPTVIEKESTPVEGEPTFTPTRAVPSPQGTAVTPITTATPRPSNTSTPTSTPTPRT